MTFCLNRMRISKGYKDSGTRIQINSINTNLTSINQITHNNRSFIIQFIVSFFFRFVEDVDFFKSSIERKEIIQTAILNESISKKYTC